MRDRLQALGAIPVGNAGEAFAAFMQSEHDKWAKVITAAGIKPQ